VALTLAAMLGGVYASFWIDSAPAPTIILLLSIGFVLAFVRPRLLMRAAFSV
jgi:manganese/iron transport system permease protein